MVLSKHWTIDPGGKLLAILPTNNGTRFYLWMGLKSEYRPKQLQQMGMPWNSIHISTKRINISNE